MSYHGQNCLCDKCAASYNARANEYNQVHSKGKIYGETDEEFKRRCKQNANHTTVKSQSTKNWPFKPGA